MAEFQLFDDTEQGYKDFVQLVHDNFFEKRDVDRAIKRAIENVRLYLKDMGPNDVFFDDAEHQSIVFCKYLANELARTWNV
jgi:hypothetical protein